MEKLYVIIPAYNEGMNIEATVKDIQDKADSIVSDMQEKGDEIIEKIQELINKQKEEIAQ